MMRMLVTAVSVAALAMTAGCESMGTSGTKSSTGSTGGPSTAASTPSASTGPKRDRLEGIPLVWKPTNTLSQLGAIDITDAANAKVQIDTATDARSDQSLIGQNNEKQPPRKVTTPDSVANFVTEQTRKLFSNTGFNVVPSGGTAVVKIDLRSFFVDEADTYKSDVRMAVTVLSPSGKTLWTGVTAGGATRFGRSYKAENYYETYSDALTEAVFNLLQNPGFRKALAGKS